MARLLFILLISAIEMGFVSVSHPMLSMHTMQMEERVASHIGDTTHGSREENSTGSCCDEIAPFSQSCSFLVPEYTCIDLTEGGKEVISSNHIVQYIFIEIVTPPPIA